MILATLLIGTLAFAFNVKSVISEKSAPLLWNYATERRVNTVSVSSNNKYVVAGSDDRNVYCFDLATGQRIWSYDTGEWSTRVDISIFDVCVSPDNKYTIAGTASNIYCFNTTTGKKEWNFTTDEREVRSVFVTSDNKYVIAGTFDNDIFGNGHVYCLNVTDGTLEWTFQTGYLFSVLVSPDNQYVLAGGASGVTALDINGTLLWNYDSTNIYVSSLFVSPDSKYVIAGDIGGIGHVYALSIKDGQQIWNFSAIGTPPDGASNIAINSIFTSSDGKSVVAADTNGEIYCLDVNDGHLIWRCSAGDFVYDVSISSDGKYVVGGGRQGDAGILTCLNRADGSELWKYTLANVTWGMWSVSISSDSNYIVGGGGAGNGSIYVFCQTLGLTPFISPLSVSKLTSQPLSFTSTVSSGYAPYNYQWYLNDRPVLGATSDTWNFTSPLGGIYYVYLKVTDAVGNTAESSPARITVTPSIPVGGFSISVGQGTKLDPLTPYLTIVLISVMIFTAIKRKTRVRARIIST